jgi:hypothetical protein
MKPLPTFPILAAVALVGYLLITSDDRNDQIGEAAAAGDPTRPASPPPTATLTDQLKIFRSAFWRSPVAGDEILHAERREWSDQNGLDKWQWFLALRPSPELVKYVRDDNAFGLSETTTPAPVEGAPAWFAFDPDAVEVLRSSSSNLQFIFSGPDNTLYATSDGSAFQRGAAERSRPSPPAISSTGRLPLTPPPDPREP